MWLFWPQRSHDIGGDLASKPSTCSKSWTETHFRLTYDLWVFVIFIA
ncbi:hypothetical protein VFA_002451 [Vibrio furnissii CIP 102972]|nr:hypothetical protein VFA_002451 [Vibrio furnissii CIP 102972]